MSDAAISKDDFAVLIAQTGLTLTPEQVEDLRQAHGFVRAMAERVRTPRGREAEPAHIFTFPHETLS